ncbi:cytokine receptor common subunit gamma-like isoform X2 [Etheostoma cragini]|uniref:cytokine receptor common subunit gamma-like isoform X2 n=1 Tax=Etheostoma cragini TaxID=417921 RepID=UPI00155DF8A2|nr:cytokine receptor common subunit gamma-like isoform X2 [Etheostoma cragini]
MHFLLAMMLTRLLLLLCLTGHVFAKEPPDVDCLVVHLKYVHCSWNKEGTPEVNYTFYGWFQGANVSSECPSYLSENNINTGCNQPYGLLNRFNTFYTRLVQENQSPKEKEHNLKTKVKFNPPTNLTVQYGADSNLWLNWTQTSPNCVESQVRYRINKGDWAPSFVSLGKQNYCLNLPSRSSLYELQVRSKMGYSCGDSIFWSDWSEPVVWGSNNSTDPVTNSSMSVWTPVLYAVGAFILIILVMMLLHHERIRIIFIPVVPKPSPNLQNIEDWFKFPKSLKEGLNYNERPCPVREYCHVRQSDSESSDCSTCSVTTDQTDCSVFIPVNELDLSTPCSSSISQF